MTKVHTPTFLNRTRATPTFPHIELAGFLAELTSTRAMNERLRALELQHLQSRCQNSLPRRWTTPIFQLVAAQRAVAAHPDTELVGKGGSPLGNWPKFSKVSSTRRPERPSPEGGPCATLAQPHCTAWYHPDFLEPSRNMEESSLVPTRVQIAFGTLLSRSTKAAGIRLQPGVAVSPHPHKRCLMPFRPLCNAGIRVSTPPSRAGLAATRDAVEIPRVH